MLREYLKAFVRDYDGPQISVLAAGAAISVIDVTKIPGSSRVLYGFHAPYATEATCEFINTNFCGESAHNFKLKCVSETAAFDLLLSLERYNKKHGEWNLCNVAVTGAVTTNRYRRGNNHSFIAFRNKEMLVEVWHHNLMKLPEEFFTEDNKKSNADWDNRVIKQRVEDDENFSVMALALGTGFNTETSTKWMVMEKELGHLKRVR